MELIKKLKEMNTFLNEMVTYWDKEAGGENSGDPGVDKTDTGVADKTAEKEESEDEAAAEETEETDSRRKKRMKRRF